MPLNVNKVPGWGKHGRGALQEGVKTGFSMFFPHFRHAEFYSLYITEVGCSPYEAISAMAKE